MIETELLNRIKQNPEEFSVFFKLYYKQIFGYIFRRTGDFDDTADIASNTFLNAFRHINNFNYKGISIKAWLYRIATNEVNLHFRHRKKNNSIFESMNNEDETLFSKYISQDKEELEKELKKHEQFNTVLNSLKTLPLHYQEVIALRYFEGKSMREIVEILNIKEGTLKSLLSRGIEKLREKCNQI